MHITSTQLTLEGQHTSEISSSRLVVATNGDGAAAPFKQLVLDDLRRRVPVSLESPSHGILTTPQEDAIDTVLAMLLNQQKPPPIYLPRDSFGPVESQRDLSTLDLSEPPRAPLRQVAIFEQTRASESCTFAASGKVCLADGSERQFSVEYALQRSEESTQIGLQRLVDPLMLDFGAPQASLNGGAVSFDLNSDGALESMRMPDSSSSLLFYDRNHNGVADNGSELFGPQSGDGFAELARLDSDGNGWIDSADPAFASLSLWGSQGEGKTRVQSLAQAGVGALATSKVDTPFTLKDRGETVGQMRAGSVWLGESGGAGSIRQVDLATTPIASPGAT